VALQYDLIPYKHVKDLLSAGMFKEEDKQQKAVPEHKNLRGPGYYN